MNSVSRFAAGFRAATLAVAVAIGGAPSVAQADASPNNWWFYIHNDRAKEVQGLLRQGADPNVLYKNGQPAIMRAVVDGAWGVFDVLAADPRTDLNAVNPANETALMYLAVAGETERARKLIGHGAQVNRLGWTPLHYAASKGHIDTAKLLLANKAMVNAPSPEGTTPIMMAALSGKREMVQLLLDAGADITTRNLKGQNAADWAYTAKHGQLGEHLTKLIAQVEGERMAQRGGVPPAPGADAAVAREANSSAPDITSAQVPATETAQSAAPREGMVGGVSGVRLGTYE